MTRRASTIAVVTTGIVFLMAGCASQSPSEPVAADMPVMRMAPGCTPPSLQLPATTLSIAVQSSLDVKNWTVDDTGGGRLVSVVFAVAEPGTVLSTDLAPGSASILASSAPAAANASDAQLDTTSLSAGEYPLLALIQSDPSDCSGGDQAGGVGYSVEQVATVVIG